VGKILTNKAHSLANVHLAGNIGDVPYEEITVIFLGHADDVPQPAVSE
jgi:hypothetical protein